MTPKNAEQPLSLKNITGARQRTKAVEAWLDATTTSTDPDLNLALSALQADEDALNGEKSGLLALAAVSVALAAIFATVYQQQQTLPPEKWSELGTWSGLLFIITLFVGAYCTWALSWITWRGSRRPKVVLRLLQRRRDNEKLRAELAAEEKAKAEAERQRLEADAPVRAWRFVRVRGRTRQGQVYLAPKGLTRS